MSMIYKLLLLLLLFLCQVCASADLSENSSSLDEVLANIKSGAENGLDVSAEFGAFHFESKNEFIKFSDQLCKILFFNSGTINLRSTEIFNFVETLVQEFECSSSTIQDTYNYLDVIQFFLLYSTLDEFPRTKLNQAIHSLVPRLNCIVDKVDLLESYLKYLCEANCELPAVLFDESFIDAHLLIDFMDSFFAKLFDSDLLPPKTCFVIYYLCKVSKSSIQLSDRSYGLLLQAMNRPIFLDELDSVSGILTADLMKQFLPKISHNSGHLELFFEILFSVQFINSLSSTEGSILLREICDSCPESPFKDQILETSLEKLKDIITNLKILKSNQFCELKLMQTTILLTEPELSFTLATIRKMRNNYDSNPNLLKRRAEPDFTSLKMIIDVTDILRYHSDHSIAKLVCVIQIEVAFFCFEHLALKERDIEFISKVAVNVVRAFEWLYISDSDVVDSYKEEFKNSYEFIMDNCLSVYEQTNPNLTPSEVRNHARISHMSTDSPLCIEFSNRLASVFLSSTLYERENFKKIGELVVYDRSALRNAFIKHLSDYSKSPSRELRNFLKEFFSVLKAKKDIFSKSELEIFSETFYIF
jgi:hypothetical protein